MPCASEEATFRHELEYVASNPRKRCALISVLLRKSTAYFHET